jgi:transposase-like protein
VDPSDNRTAPSTRCNRPNDDALPFSANSRCVLGMHGRPRSFWIPLVAAVERGANLHGVAERHGVNPSTLAWWRTVLRREQRAEVPALLPLVLDAAVPRDAAVSHDGTVEVLVDGATLRVAVGTDVQYVAALARALVRSC